MKNKNIYEETVKLVNYLKRKWPYRNSDAENITLQC